MLIFSRFNAWCCWLLISLCVALLSNLAFAADVLAVVDSRHPLQVPAGVRIIVLDEPARIEAQLAANLPADPSRSAAIVRERLERGGEALRHRIATSYRGVVDAWSLGVTTIPAVIVDGRYVVYGEPDIAKAIARIEAHRSAQP
ncbi:MULTISPECIES: TIGR03757 family integrating conjugative element protein [Alcaligenaceae]|uniref:Integrating conjugative element protein (TIGR03757 family) n=1 Tax=Eoetvoesiella caeni TaxID=645616 RepID=A0A366H523_9BURK|nr:TIGR03757 family integrating conjugative element protein [Eoetvoesiella caeni]MCI2810326.1 TIGR03757 family integrating conjugative element protein [Eoetvoesiella caeni]NYT54695.1 TIGR03757 family integrating conjugative element protein [Eoetvoesiella caeni]RBP37136.1 integrating conjugative element protein (TIGR03757 family) [Eoetvoesiella caeni]